MAGESFFSIPWRLVASGVDPVGFKERGIKRSVHNFYIRCRIMIMG
ncbi:hypothetical protein D3OALGB2SA_5808 [Olavius algarvensis associated proteobacterium Delta 3]|nr:hypothetical protein D3OALGB2SA_5808 [Olavius algarvensis associated proteobacterium Delta 3]